MSERQLRRFVETATVIAALSLTLTSYAVAANDIFLKIDGIAGESQDSKHAGEVDILSWSWGMTQAGTAHAGSGMGSGKVNVQDITLTKYTDKATTGLISKSTSGNHIKEMTLTMRKAGKGAQDYIKLHLYDCVVSSITLGAAGGAQDRPTENVSVNFSRFEVDYAPQAKDGTLQTPVSATWDINKNSAF